MPLEERLLHYECITHCLLYVLFPAIGISVIPAQSSGLNYISDFFFFFYLLYKCLMHMAWSIWLGGEHASDHTAIESSERGSKVRDGSQNWHDAENDKIIISNSISF